MSETSVYTLAKLTYDLAKLPIEKRVLGVAQIVDNVLKLHDSDEISLILVLLGMSLASEKAAHATLETAREWSNGLQKERDNAPTEKMMLMSLAKEPMEKERLQAADDS